MNIRALAKSFGMVVAVLGIPLGFVWLVENLPYVALGIVAALVFAFLWNVFYGWEKE